jgi:putative RecB family exonuclease
MRDVFGPPKAPRSVSQLNQYKRCPYSYYLARIKKAWQRPAAWLPQGTAVHETAEWWERGGRKATVEEMLAYFNAAYDADVNRYLKITPNTSFWSASGQYHGARDIQRRFEKGREQVVAYHRYYTETAPKDAIWIAPDGTPGIELGFDFDLDGVRIRGFIDAMISRPLSIPQHTDEGVITHEIIVRDNKTGNNPGDDFQLAVYGIAITDSYGVEVPLGDYWMGRSGKPTAPFDLTKWPRSRVAESFAELEAQLDKGDFPPLPETDRCHFCDVSAACEYRV